MNFYGFYIIAYLSTASTTNKKDTIREYTIKINSFKKFFSLRHNCSTKKDYLLKSSFELLYTDQDLGYETDSDVNPKGEGGSLNIPTKNEDKSHNENIDDKNTSDESSSELSCDPKVKFLKFKYKNTVLPYPDLNFIDVKFNFFMTSREIKKIDNDETKLMVQMTMNMSEEYKEVYTSVPYVYCSTGEGFIRLSPSKKGIMFSMYRCMIRKYGYDLYEDSEKLQERLKLLEKKITDDEEYLKRLATSKPLKHLSNSEDTLKLIRELLTFMNGYKFKQATHIFNTLKFCTKEVFPSKINEKYFVLEVFQDLTNLLNYVDENNTKFWIVFIFDDSKDSVEQDLFIYTIVPSKNRKRTKITQTE